MNMPTIQAVCHGVCETKSANGSVFETGPDQNDLRYLDSSSGRSVAGIALDDFDGLQALPLLMNGAALDPKPAEVLIRVRNAAGTKGGPATKIVTAQQVMDAAVPSEFFDALFGN